MSETCQQRKGPNDKATGSTGRKRWAKLSAYFTTPPSILCAISAKSARARTSSQALSDRNWVTPADIVYKQTIRNGAPIECCNDFPQPVHYPRVPAPSKHAAEPAETPLRHSAPVGSKLQTLRSLRMAHSQTTKSAYRLLIAIRARLRRENARRS